MQENPHGGSYTTGGSSSSTAGLGSVLPPIEFVLDLDAEPKPPPAVKAKPRTVPLTPPVMQPPPAAMMQPPPVRQPPPQAAPAQEEPPQEPPQAAEAPAEAPQEEPPQAADPNTLHQPTTPSVPTIDPGSGTDSTRDPSGSSCGSTE